MSADLFDRAGALFRETQESIIGALESLEAQHGDGSRFRRDEWTRGPESNGPITGGGGLTCVLEGGRVFERAGVNFSAVRGRYSEEFARTLPGEGLDFAACGVSLVIHPRSPRLPTVHMNHRRLSRGATGWFGGGSDLTPYVLDEDDARHFHRTLHDACARHPAVASYDRFKRECDDYFYNHHRGEARGLGGIFFDYLTDDPEETLAFMRDSCAAFLLAYLPIVERHIDEDYTDAEREWQKLRRGRYVEFNLLHDRGTMFGLRTGGRVESILMSMPPEVSWRYAAEPEAGSREAALLEVLRTPRSWVGAP
ncbi:MAG: oxygen-dependent coproporphyrinogen oxidase [Myxococcales bacterium]|nr:oxygen-dependent coproporphyrinogen oxidase [Myxococcales bacterium]